jgi:hypothetical protein
MNILTVNLILSTIVFWIAAQIYLLPRLHDLPPQTVLTPILLLHALRHLGLMFLSPGANYPGMPTMFAHPAAIGDLAAALLALVGLMAMTKRLAVAGALLWLFSIGGFLDLMAAITLATIYDAEPFMGAAYWIPAFWVPALLVTHVVAIMVLWRQGTGLVRHAS